MTDRNTISQVIESLFEDWIDRNIDLHPLAVENMRILEADAIAILKEQDAVVRCKDCEYACICSDEWVICTHIDSNGNDKHPTDWFCADGRRRDE